MKLLCTLVIWWSLTIACFAAEPVDTNCTQNARIDYDATYDAVYYPKWILKFDLSGYVRVAGEVDTNGFMHDIIILESYCDEFNDIVVKALQSVKHRPARRNCTLVSQRIVARVWFATKKYSRLPKVDLVIRNYNQMKPTKEPKSVGRFYYQRGMQLFRMGEDSLAQIDYYQAMAEMGGVDLPYFDEAIYDEIKFFLPSNLESTDSLEVRAALLNQFFLFAKAIECYDTIINRNLNNASIALKYKQARAETYGRMKYFDKSIAGYLECLSLAPNDTNALTNLGWYYYLDGKYDSCMYYSKKVMDMNISGLTARFNYALVHLRLGKIKEAQNLYKESIVNAMKSNYQTNGAIDDILDLVKSNIEVKASRDILLNYFNLNEKSIAKYFDD